MKQIMKKGLKLAYWCYKVIQRFRITGLFAGLHNTKVHGTITDVIYKYISLYQFYGSIFLRYLLGVYCTVPMVPNTGSNPGGGWIGKKNVAFIKQTFCSLFRCHSDSRPVREQTTVYHLNIHILTVF